MRYGVQADGDTVIIRNRWRSVSLLVVWLALGGGAGVALGVWLERLVGRGSALPFLVVVLLALGLSRVVGMFRGRHHHTAVLDRDGIRVMPAGPSLAWSEIRMVRAVVLPQRGCALAVVSGPKVIVLSPTVSLRRRRLQSLRTACGPLMVLHPGVFQFDLLDDAPVRFPRVDNGRYSTVATVALADGRELPPIVRMSRRQLIVVATVWLVVVGAVVWREVTDDGSAPSATTFAPNNDLFGLEPTAATADVCHGIWWQPPGWSPSALVERVTYLRGTTTVWELTAPAQGAVSFQPDGGLPRWTLDDIVESYDYTLVGSLPEQPALAGDHVVIVVAGDPRDLSCAEI